MQNIRLWLTLLLTLSALEAREITDMLGRSVEIPDAPQKVYAPSPYGSYALYAMDPSLLAGWIFNIDTRYYSYLDPRMKELPVLGRVLGAGQSANLEVLLAQHPDLILMWSHKNEFTKKEAERLKLLQTPSVYAKDVSLLDYVDIFRFLGTVLQRKDRGEALARYSENAFADTLDLVAKIPKEKRPSVYYAEGLDGLATECDDSIHVELLKLAGDVNVHRCHTSSHKGFEKLSMETLLQYDPDVIFVQEKIFYDKIYTMELWQNLKAVKNKKVYLIPRAPFNWFDRPPSFMRILGLQWLISKLYPEAYTPNINQVSKTFYQLFLNVSLSNAQLEAIFTGTDAEKKRQKNGNSYDKNARTVNAPMYDYYAKKIKDITKITKGVCLDVGSGGGYMGLALAKITDLDFIFLDISNKALEKAKTHIIEDGLEKRARTLQSDVHAIALDDASVDLVISRGSIPFWYDPARGLSEIYRVLKKGGKAYVGGGKGSPEIRAQINAQREKLGMKPFGGTKKVHGDGMKRDYAALLKDVGITQFKIHKGKDGRWIELWK